MWSAARAGVPLAPISRAALIVSSATLLVAAFPPFSIGLCAWVALVPLLFALRGLGPVPAALAGGAWALLANAGVFAWMSQAFGFRWYHFIALDIVYSSLGALWCAVVARFGLRRPWDLYVGAAAWVLAEFVRAHAGFLGLPLAMLAHTQMDVPAVVQIAALLGEPAVSFVVILANLAVFHALSTGYSRGLLVSVVPLLLAPAIGAAVVRASSRAHDLRSVAALDTRYSPRGEQKISNAAQTRETLEFLSRNVPGDSALAVLPESAFIRPRPEDLLALRSFTDSYGGTLVAGVSGTAKLQPGPPAAPGVLDLRASNTAWIFVPGRTPQRYLKAVRMPFGEYLPFSSWISWPRWLVGHPPEVIAGPGPQTYVVGNDLRIGVMICWEALVASHARTLAQQGATLLVVIANDAWFGGDGAASLQGLAARMRAVELRRPLVLAANGGRSMVIDRFGRVVAQASGPAALQWVRADVAADGARTPYARWGDIFVALCVLAVVVVGLGGVARTRYARVGPTACAPG